LHSSKRKLHIKSHQESAQGTTAQTQFIASEIILLTKLNKTLVAVCFILIDYVFVPVLLFFRPCVNYSYNLEVMKNGDHNCHAAVQDVVRLLVVCFLVTVTPQAKTTYKQAYSNDEHEVENYCHNIPRFQSYYIAFFLSNRDGSRQVCGVDHGSLAVQNDSLKTAVVKKSDWQSTLIASSCKETPSYRLSCSYLCSVCCVMLSGRLWLIGFHLGKQV